MFRNAYHRKHIYSNKKSRRKIIVDNNIQRACPLCSQAFTPADGMTADEHLARGILRTYAEMQGKENTLPCPRCGENSMDTNVLRNALSRHFDIHICDACGNMEAVLLSEGKSIPLESWWAVGELLKRK
jgi:predicted RNA-binding Zn-ribbon protein involved in translation (DUF1610 family)